MPVWIVPLAFLIFFEAVADICAITWSQHSKIHYAVFAISAYIIGNLFWLFALRNGSGLGRGSIIFSIASAIIAVVIGLAFYGEKVGGIQAIGIALGLVSIFFLVWE